MGNKSSKTEPTKQNNTIFSYKEKDRLLVYGCLRRYTNKLSITLPSDIQKLCFIFYYIRIPNFEWNKKYIGSSALFDGYRIWSSTARWSRIISSNIINNTMCNIYEYEIKSNIKISGRSGYAFVMG